MSVFKTPKLNFFCWWVNESGCARGPDPAPQLPTNQGSRRFSQIIQLSLVFYSLSFFPFFAFTLPICTKTVGSSLRALLSLCALTPLSLFVLFTLRPKMKRNLEIIINYYVNQFSFFLIQFLNCAPKSNL